MKSAQRRFLLVSVATLATDAATKIWAVNQLDAPVSLVGSLSLQLSYNPGVAFGLGDSLPSFLLLAITAAVCVAIAIGGWTGSLRPPVAIGLILGGALGNLFDRFLGGTVVDMVHLTWWPTFNLADTAITLGAVGLVWSSLRPATISDEHWRQPA